MLLSMELKDGGAQPKYVPEPKHVRQQAKCHDESQPIAILPSWWSFIFTTNVVNNTTNFEGIIKNSLYTIYTLLDESMRYL